MRVNDKKYYWASFETNGVKEETVDEYAVSFCRRKRESVDQKKGRDV